MSQGKDLIDGTDGVVAVTCFVPFPFFDFHSLPPLSDEKHSNSTGHVVPTSWHAGQSLEVTLR